MNEMVSSSESQSTYTPEPSSSPAPSETQNSTSTQDGRLFSQSEINDIVRRAKTDAVESYKRKAADRPEYASSQNGSYIPQTNQTTSQQQYMSPDDVRKMAAEESLRLRDEWVKGAQIEAQQQDAQRIVHEFFNKLSSGKEKYSDFDDVVGSIEYRHFPNVVQLVNSYVDNPQDVMYELGKDRGKLALLEQLTNMSPNDAIYQARRLSQSIKDNEASGKTRLANEPLSQMRPSNTGTGSGALSVSDYRKKFKV